MSLDTSDQFPKITSLSPVFARPTVASSPTLTDLTEDASRLTSHDRAGRYHHVGGYHGVGQDFAILLDHAERAQHCARANVDMVADCNGRDVRAWADEDIVANPDWVVDHLTFADATRWAERAACCDDCVSTYADGCCGTGFGIVSVAALAGREAVKVASQVDVGHDYSAAS